MADQWNFYGMVARLYEAAAEKDGWLPVCQALAADLGALNSGAWIARPEGVLTLAHNYSQLAWQQYNAYYHQLDLWHRAALQTRSFDAMLGERLVPTRDVIKSEFYGDFGRAHGAAHALGATISIDGMESGVVFHLAVTRDKQAGGFSERDEWYLRRLIPHIQSAIRLYLKLQNLERRAMVALQALDVFAMGVLVVDSEARADFVNRAAEKIAARKDGLVLGKQGSLSAMLSAETRTLRQLISSVSDGGPGGAMNLSRRNRRPPYSVLVSPFPPPLGECAHGSVLVLIGEPSADDGLPEQWLTGICRLSSAELSVCKVLVSGQTADEIAEARQVSVNTVRTQISSILAKTGTQSVRELCVMLGRVPKIAR